MYPELMLRLAHQLQRERWQEAEIERLARRTRVARRPWSRRLWLLLRQSFVLRKRASETPLSPSKPQGEQVPAWHQPVGAGEPR
jgi:hypothetical protein